MRDYTVEHWLIQAAAETIHATRKSSAKEGPRGTRAVQAERTVEMLAPRGQHDGRLSLVCDGLRELQPLTGAMHADFSDHVRGGRCQSSPWTKSSTGEGCWNTIIR